MATHIGILEMTQSRSTWKCFEPALDREPKEERRFRWIDSSDWKSNLLVIFIKHNQINYLKLDVATSVRGLRQKKLVLNSSDSWHDGKMPCQDTDQGGRTHPKGRTTGHELRWGQLPTEPRIRPLSWHGIFMSCQESEELSTSFFWRRLLTDVETSSFR